MILIRKILLSVGLVCAFFCCSAQPINSISSKEFSVKGQGNVVTKYLKDQQRFFVSAGNTSPEASIVMDLGWLPVEPNRSYAVNYNFIPENLKSPSSIYLMVREHSVKGGTVLHKNYFKESTRVRKVELIENGKSITRTLGINTTADTKYISASIIIGGLNGELNFSDFAIADKPKDDNAPLTYEAVVSQLAAEGKSRKVVTKRSLVFSRAQMKYDFGKNYYHQWNDRPFFTSRDYRETSKYTHRPKSYVKTLEEVKKYDIDGLALFPETKGRFEMMTLHDSLSVGTLKGVQILPEFFIPGDSIGITLKEKIIKAALLSPNTPRINGKVLITSYGFEQYKSTNFKVFLDSLRSRVGDTFVFLPNSMAGLQLRSHLLKGKNLTKSMIETEKQIIRDILNVCDGIYFNYPPALTNLDHTFDVKFYKEIFVPLYQSVLAEEPYKNKYWGLSAYRSHMNPDRKNNLHEDLTRTLRNSFETAMNANPDVIILPEWDEQNENTGFFPTVYSATYTQRLLRYYMSKIKKIMPTPISGDDISIPNLILTTPKISKLGDKIAIELLNIPDNHSTGGYSVELALKDDAGKLVYQFSKVSFLESELKEKRFYLSSHHFKDFQTLTPVISIKGYKGKDLVFDGGFHNILVRATWNWDHLAVKQPLRSIIRTPNLKINWDKPVANSESYLLKGVISSPEELASVELLGDEDEVFAVDTKNEFYRADPTKELFIINFNTINANTVKGAIELKGTTAKWLPFGINATIDEKSIKLDTVINGSIQWIYFAIPTQDVPNAQLIFNLDKGVFSVPFKELKKQKMIAKSFENGFYIAVAPYHRQIDMPQSIDKKEVSFSVEVSPEHKAEVFQLRLLTKGGKIFISNPITLPQKNSALKKLRVYSDSLQKGVDVLVDEGRIPKIKYDFNPDRGSVLLTDAGQPFWATIGGTTNITTGRGTINALFRGVYPSKSLTTAPKWGSEDGKPCLEFDGKGTFVVLPRETLPFKGAFTLSLEVKPANNKDQYILMNRVIGLQMGLGIEIKDGNLLVTYRDHQKKVNKFETALPVIPGRWSSIKVSYDFEQMKVTLNDETKSYPLKTYGDNLGFTVIGEAWKGKNWFEGKLRALSIYHNVE